MIEIMSQSICQYLREIPGTERAFDQGQFLFHQGDPVSVIHLILEGSVHLARHQDDGFLLITRRTTAGSVLAEPSLFSDRYHCDAIADSPTRTRSVPKHTVRARLIEQPEFAEAWNDHVTGVIHDAMLRTEILSFKTVAARLNAWIALHGGSLPAKGRWKTVASEIGTSPEALYREIAKRRRA